MVRASGGRFLRDLSVLMLGEVARRAARECLEGPVGVFVS